LGIPLSALRIVHFPPVFSSLFPPPYTHPPLLLFIHWYVFPGARSTRLLKQYKIKEWYFLNGQYEQVPSNWGLYYYGIFIHLSIAVYSSVETRLTDVKLYRNIFNSCHIRRRSTKIVSYTNGRGSYLTQQSLLPKFFRKDNFMNSKNVSVHLAVQTSECSGDQSECPFLLTTSSPILVKGLYNTRTVVSPNN